MNRTFRTAVIVMSLATLVFASPALADSWAPPTPGIYASEWGRFGFKLLAPKFGGSARGGLFRLNDKGEETVVWDGKLVNTPHRVYIGRLGHVVTVDTYGNLGFAHSLVVYDTKGKAVADYKLEDLLTADEIAKHALRTVSSRHWAGNAKFSFDESASSFLLELPSKRTIKVDLKTGKLK